MTLDGYALTGLFVVMFGFLCVTAYIFERAEPDPISPDDRLYQAHLFRPSTEGSAAVPVPPSGAVDGPEPSVDVREPSGQRAG